MFESRFAANHEASVLEFLSANEGSFVVRRPTYLTTIVHSGGMTRKQVRDHTIMAIVTLGVSLPVFLMVGILRAPKVHMIMTYAGSGETVIMDIDSYAY